MWTFQHDKSTFVLTVQKDYVGILAIVFRFIRRNHLDVVGLIAILLMIYYDPLSHQKLKNVLSSYDSISLSASPGHQIQNFHLQLRRSNQIL